MVTIAEILSAKQQLKEAEKKYKKSKKAAKHKPQKSYLSRNDREELMVLAAIAGKFEELLENWYKFQRPQKQITYIKTALTYTYKAMDNYFDVLTEGEKKQEIYRLLRDLKQCSIYLKR